MRGDLALLFGRRDGNGVTSSLFHVCDEDVFALAVSHGLIVGDLPPLRRRQALAYHFLTGRCLHLSDWPFVHNFGTCF